MDDPGQAIVGALDALADVASGMTAQEAVDEIDAATLQTFFKEWPSVSTWAGTLWRLLSTDLERPPPTTPDLEEIGGEG